MHRLRTAPDMKLVSKFSRNVVAAFATVLAIGAQTSHSQTNPDSSENDGPKIVLAEPYYDFGRIPADKIVSHDFVITNAGNQTLEIYDVRSSCGCTTTTNWNRRIEPGKTGTIPILFNTGGMAGPVQKNLWVISNDTNQPSAVILFTATIWKFIDAIPVVAAFSFGTDFQTNETRIIKLVSNLPEPVTLSEPVCTNRSFKTELKTIEAGKEFELHITVVPPLGPGSLTVPITMNSSSSNMPVVSVTAYAMVKPALTLTPAKIVLPEMPLTEAEQFTIKIKNNASNPVTLSEPFINYKKAKIKLHEIEPGRLYNLEVSFPSGFNCADRPVEIHLKSTHQQSPVVRVPVIQFQSVFD